MEYKEFKKVIQVMNLFKDELNAIEAGNCPFCKEPIDLRTFKDEMSRKEFSISGLCQACQDEFFGGGSCD
jgi:hypothetical protein